MDKQRLFEIHYANFQAISKAQKVHLTTLLAYLGLVWVWYVLGDSKSITVQMLGVSIKAAGFWTITPFIVTFFALALIGSVNAAGPARKKLEELEPENHFEFYELDTHKNILDYFTFLRLHPEKPITPSRRDERFRFAHFLYMSPVVIGIFTTYFAMRRPDLSNEPWFQGYAGFCLCLQLVFAVRPFWRATCRFLGVRRKTTT